MAMEMIPMGTRFQTAASALPSAGTGFTVGFDEEPFLLEGWGPRTTYRPGPIACRSLEPNARFRLWVGPGAMLLKMLLTVPEAVQSLPACGSDCYRAEVFFENQPIGELEVRTPQWVLRRFPIPAVSQSRIGEFGIAAKPPISTFREGNDNQNPESATCFIAAIQVEPSAGLGRGKAEIQQRCAD